MLLACTNVTWVKNCTTLLYTQKAEEQLIRNNKLNWWENSSLPWSRQGRSKYLLALMTGFHKILLVPVLFLNSQYRTLHGSLNSWTLKLGLYCSFPQPTKTLHEEINTTIRKEIYVLFHSNYSLFWQTSYFQQVSLLWRSGHQVCLILPYLLWIHGHMRNYYAKITSCVRMYFLCFLSFPT